MTLTVGVNSYITQAEADSYLASSIRAATNWAALTTATKEAALISAWRLLEKQRYQGANAGLLGVATAAVNAGGTGYAEDDVLTVVGGTGVSAQVKVTSVAGGVVTAVSLLHTGFYSGNPTLTGAATTGGGGSGCTLDLTMTTTQDVAWPRTSVTDRYGDAVDETTIPQGVKDAQAELAYELSQDVALESQTSASDNNKRVKAGSVEVEKFRPVSGARFPHVVQEYLGEFLESAAISGLTGPYASGTDAESSFTDLTPYDPTRGY